MVNNRRTNNLTEVTIEDARLLFKNFAGEAKPMNEKGRRNFNVALPPEVAEAMERDGWSVKYLKPREEEDAPQAIIKVNVNYAGARPPRIVMITSRGRNELHEDTVSTLDYAEIERVDLIIRPYEWEPGKISAYLKSLYVTIKEDDLERKYAEVPDSDRRGPAFEERYEGYEG